MRGHVLPRWQQRVPRDASLARAGKSAHKDLLEEPRAGEHAHAQVVLCSDARRAREDEQMISEPSWKPDTQPRARTLSRPRMQHADNEHS